MQFFWKHGRGRAREAGALTRFAGKRHRWLLLTMAFCLPLCAPKKICGQEALRQSLAGEEVTRAQQNAAATIGYYNLLLGETALRFSTGLGVQYNDNIHLQNDHPQGDFIFTPNLNTQIHSPLTENNSLDISLGAGYSAYVNNPDLDQFNITPGSGIAFNIFIGDFAINLHDRVSITENGYQNPTVNGNGNNASLVNAAGTDVAWDLNQVVLNAVYNHVNYVSLGSSQSAPNSASDNLSLNAGVRVRPEIIVGVEGGGSQIDYDQSSQNTSPNTKQWSVGGFGRLQISEYLNAQLDAGYTALTPESTSTNLVTSDTSGFYFDFSLSHRLNQFLNYSLSAGRSQDLQAYGQPYSTYFVRLTPNWNFIKNYQFSTPVWWVQGTQIFNQANTSNTYDQYGAGFNIGRPITQKLSSSLSYQFIKETSGQANLNYIVNIISLNFSYQF
jgi:hypothetical protein